MDRVQHVGVVGAGFMGSGIAESVARAGLSVVLYEPEAEPLERSRDRIADSVGHAVARGKLDAAEAEQLRARIEWTTDFDSLAGADLVIEAVVEDAGVKGEVFRRLDELVPASALLASNTSSIPVAQLASATRHPERVIGLHFFSPVPVMKLVEIVVAIDTAPDAVARAEAFARAIGKHPIRTKDRSGFIV